jgi:hypothetical protein
MLINQRISKNYKNLYKSREIFELANCADNFDPSYPVEAITC